MESSNASGPGGSFWTVGDYAGFAEMTRPASLMMLDAMAPQPGERVLDLACGAGNFAVPAAERGAVVTALDITPELLELACADAERAGVEIDFREGDVQSLPFPDDSFDHVASVLGIVAADNTELAVGEMLRVCRPGGTVAISAWTADGMIGQMFDLVAMAMIGSPRVRAIDWGAEDHVRRVFGEGISWNFSKPLVEFRGDSPEDLTERMVSCIPPLVMATRALGQRGGVEQFHADLQELFTRYGHATDDGFVSGGEHLLSCGKLAA